MDLSSHYRSVTSERSPYFQHIGYVPYKTGGKRMICTCIAAIMRSIECSRCLSEVLYTYILGFLTNNGMPPANIFDILVRSALTAHVRRGSDNALSTRRLYGKYFAEKHNFFQA